MKTRSLIITLFCILLSATVNAQNWKLINPNERYHFQHIDDTMPLHTILTDSAKLVGEDSVFYLNRFFLPIAL